MTILSAKFANSENTSVELLTEEASFVAVQTAPLPDVSGGWQAVYEAWIAAGHTPEPYTQPQE